MGISGNGLIVVTYFYSKKKKKAFKLGKILISQPGGWHSMAHRPNPVPHLCWYGLPAKNGFSFLNKTVKFCDTRRAYEIQISLSMKFYRSTNTFHLFIDCLLLLMS